VNVGGNIKSRGDIDPGRALGEGEPFRITNVIEGTSSILKKGHVIYPLSGIT